MSIVKGSKQRRVKVIEDRPFFRWVIAILAIPVVAGSIYLSNKLGFKEGMANQERALIELVQVQKELESSQAQVSELEQKVANIDLGAEVDRRANEEIRQEVITLKEEIASLQEENSFYRGLMAPTKNKRGLTFGAVELSEAEGDRIYSYKVVLQQLATNHQLLKGSLKYTVVGKQDGLDMTYNIKDLSSQVSAEVIRLRFKYFQTIEGKLKLPDGFEPIAIQLVAKSTGKNPVTVEKRFGWLVEEVI